MFDFLIIVVWNSLFGYSAAYFSTLSFSIGQSWKSFRCRRVQLSFIFENSPQCTGCFEYLVNNAWNIWWYRIAILNHHFNSSIFFEMIFAFFPWRTKRYLSIRLSLLQRPFNKGLPSFWILWIYYKFNVSICLRYVKTSDMDRKLSCNYKISQAIKQHYHV